MFRFHLDLVFFSSEGLVLQFWVYVTLFEKSSFPTNSLIAMTGLDFLIENYFLSSGVVVSTSQDYFIQEMIC